MTQQLSSHESELMNNSFGKLLIKYVFGKLDRKKNQKLVIDTFHYSLKNEQN